MRPHFKHYNVIFLKNNYSNAYRLEKLAFPSAEVPEIFNAFA